MAAVPDSPSSDRIDDTARRINNTLALPVIRRCILGQELEHFLDVLIRHAFGSGGEAFLKADNAVFVRIAGIVNGGRTVIRCLCPAACGRRPSCGTASGRGGRKV